MAPSAKAGSTRGGSIPPSVVASKAVARRERYQGAIGARQLPRLRAVLADDSGVLEVALELGRDGEGIGWLQGRITGTLALTCQRGLHPYDWPCAVDLRLRLVASEAEEQAVLEHDDPYLVQDDRLPLRDLVEDEVLLALPMLPRCSDPGCLDRLQGEAGRG